MKANLKHQNVSLTLELTQNELDLVMQGIGSCPANSLRSLGMTREQANTVVELWATINQACHCKYSEDLI